MSPTYLFSHGLHNFDVSVLHIIPFTCLAQSSFCFMLLQHIYHDTIFSKIQIYTQGTFFSSFPLRLKSVHIIN